MSITFDLITHQCDGKAVIFVLDKAATDSFTQGLRRTLVRPIFVDYVLRRARQLDRALKVADFGANVGTFSLPLAAHGADILAVEALPANFVALATATLRNGFRNLLPVSMAATIEPGVVSIAGNSVWASIGVTGGGNTAPSDTLVNILRLYRFTNPDIIKLDIEGAELPALAESDTFFAERPDTEVIFESNNHTCHFFDYDRQDLMRWFETRGFFTYVFRPDGLMPVRSEDPQPLSVVDVLATKRERAELEAQGEQIVPMTDEYVATQLLLLSTTTHPHHRKHFLTEVERVGDGVKNSPLWPKIVSAI